MNTITASQKNRRERIAEAMRIEWENKQTGEKFSDTYSTDLWVALNHAIDRLVPGDVCKMYFGGSTHSLTLTQLEDLCELVRRSYHAQQEAKAVR